ncbi:hypothetical protein [Pararobbsia alpina]|uniref:hypothetical protein n=1 Tax=Pararobbsia alpina TaxID=621374 RepID=UPI0039A45BA4
MKLSTLFVILVCVAAGAIGGSQIGQHIERDRIQATCEDDRAATVINGVKYECLSPALAQKLHEIIEQLMHQGEQQPKGPSA